MADRITPDREIEAPGCRSGQSHSDRRDRVIHALSRFVFPGVAVPRGAMAEAVLAALDHGDDYVEYLPAKYIIAPPEPPVLPPMPSSLGENITNERRYPG